MQKEKWKKIGKGVLNAFIISILLVTIILVVCNISLNVQKRKGSITPSIMGYAPISVYDNVMNPIICEDDLLIIYMTDDLQVGDMLTFYFTNFKDMQTQKIIRIIYDKNGEPSEYLVESSTGRKSLVQNKYVYGKVVMQLRGFAPVIHFCNSVPGTGFLIAIALMIIFMPDIIYVTRDKRRFTSSGATVQEQSPQESAEQGEQVEVKEEDTTQEQTEVVANAEVVEEDDEDDDTLKTS